MATKAAANSNLKVTVYWGDILYDTAICKTGDRVTVGRSPENTFILDVKGNHKGIALAEIDDRGAKLNFNDEIDGHLRLGKEIFSLRAAKDTKHVTKDPSGIYHARISKTDKADFVIGHVSFYFDWIKEKKKVPRSAFFTWRQTLLLLFISISFGLFVLWLNTFEAEKEEKPPERLVTVLPRKVPGLGAGAEAAKAAIGEIKTPDGGAQKGDPGKAELKASVGKAVVANLRKANLGSVLSGLASLGSGAPSADDSKVIAKIDQKGTGGFSTIGEGKGGGGKTVGIGRAVGRGEGGFEGTGRLGLSGDSAIEGGTGHGGGYGLVTTGGGLDRDVIESVIRRRLDRIRLCYERQLNFNPKLTGKVAVRFVIGKQGEVLKSSITEDTMKNSAVSSCILGEVGSWNFPPPEGGTLVNVDYPFLFESSAKGQ